MPFNHYYNHHSACGDGWFEASVVDAVQDVLQNLQGWVAFHDGFADQAEWQRNFELSQAQWALQNGDINLYNMSMLNASTQQQQVNYHRDLQGEYTEAAAIAENDLDLEAADYENEWDFWYDYYIGEGAASHDAATCADYQTPVPKP